MFQFDALQNLSVKNEAAKKLNNSNTFKHNLKKLYLSQFTTCVLSNNMAN